MDIAFSLSTDLSGADWSWTALGDDLETGDDLRTSVIVSLFSDRVAEDYPDADRRGWWGDAYNDFPLGSRLWTLRRAKRTTQTLRRAEDYCREALAWLITDGVAQSVDARAVWLNGSVLAIDLVIAQPNARSANYQFSWIWD